jgi:CheY-like chemotaxis protein
MTSETRRDAVLVVARDVLGAGLLAVLIEGTGREALFAFDGERAEHAVERLRPSLVLLDCYHPAARSDAFFSAVETIASRVVLFAPTPPWDDVADIARRPQVTAFVHAAPGESLAEKLRRALEG